ncbi:MAG: helix-turn-helix domain-containing protein [Fibrobacterota bacterium]
MDFAKNYSLSRFPESDPVFTRPSFAGVERVSTEKYFWDNKSHGPGQDRYIIQFTTGGRGFFESAGKVWSVPCHTAFLIDFKTDFKYYYKDEGKPWSFSWINFNGPSGKILFEKLITLFGPVVGIPASSYSWMMLNDIVEKMSKGGFKDIYRCSNFCNNLFLQLYKDLRSGIGGFSFYDAAGYMSDNLDRNIDISQISRKFNLSREHFSRLFTKAAGVSPGRYLKNLRLERAKELLRRGDMNLSMIAKQTGLGDANYFCRVFRAHTGLTPRAFSKTFEGTRKL